MPQCRPACSRLRGFTLIELLVLVLIVAVIATAASLSLSGAGGAREGERELERLAAVLDYACEQALLLGHDAGVHVSRTGYRHSLLEAEGWRAAANVGPLRARDFVALRPLALELDGRRQPLPAEPPQQPQLNCLASGEWWPFVLELETRDGAWRLSAGLGTRVRLERLD